MLEVLQDFPSARPPLEWLLQTVPRLRPRLFSISSALTAFPAQAHITAAIVDWVTPFKRRRQVRLTVAMLRDTALVRHWLLSHALRLARNKSMSLGTAVLMQNDAHTLSAMCRGCAHHGLQHWSHSGPRFVCRCG